MRGRAQNPLPTQGLSQPGEGKGRCSHLHSVSNPQQFCVPHLGHPQCVIASSKSPLQPQQGALGSHIWKCSEVCLFFSVLAVQGRDIPAGWDQSRGTPRERRAGTSVGLYHEFWEPVKPQGAGWVLLSILILILMVSLDPAGTTRQQ